MFLCRLLSAETFDCPLRPMRLSDRCGHIFPKSPLPAVLNDLCNLGVLHSYAAKWSLALKSRLDRDTLSRHQLILSDGAGWPRVNTGETGRKRIKGPSCNRSPDSPNAGLQTGIKTRWIDTEQESRGPLWINNHNPETAIQSYSTHLTQSSVTSVADLNFILDLRPWVLQQTPTNRYRKMKTPSRTAHSH